MLSLESLKMEEFTKAILVSPKFFFFLLALHCSSVITLGGFDGTLKGALCSPMQSDPSNPDSCNVMRLKDQIRDVLIYATLGNYATSEDNDLKTNQVHCYVRGFCHNNIKGEDCNHCLVAARDLIMACAGHEGAQVTLADCELRVETYKFYP